MSRIRIIEKDPLLEKLLQHFLEREHCFLWEQEPKAAPELLLVGVTSVHRLGSLLREYPRARLLLVSAVPAPACLRIAREIRADGLWYANACGEELRGIVREVLSGERVMPRQSPVCMLGNAESTDLTQRELAVLELLAEGETDASIAARLFVSVRTVKSHIQSMREKTGFRNRTELAVCAGISGRVLPKGEMLRGFPEK